MTIVEEKKNDLMCVKLSGVEDFEVSKVFDCGQCFRFNPVEGSIHEAEFSGIAYGRFISVGQDGRDIYIYNTTEAEFESVWKHYLALDVDYKAIKSDIASRSENPALHRAVSVGGGIRILHQEPWEAICSFIVSQNNNIPRIKKIIEAMSRECGEPIEIPEKYRAKVSPLTELYAFPSPEALVEKGIDGLFALKTGFRAKYIYDAAVRASEGRIDYERLFSSCDTDECVKHLCEIKGIGPKVASCALLFGFGRYDAFPVDVWIKKVISKYFSGEEDFSPDILGDYAGIAQQYLFYYERYING